MIEGGVDEQRFIMVIPTRMERKREKGRIYAYIQYVHSYDSFYGTLGYRGGGYIPVSKVKERGHGHDSHFNAI